MKIDMDWSDRERLKLEIDGEVAYFPLPTPFPIKSAKLIDDMLRFALRVGQERREL